MEELLKRENEFPRGFSIEGFVRAYVFESLRMAKDGLSMDSFDSQIRAIISRKMHLTKDAVKYLHHSLHWQFFCNNNSILEYVQVSSSNKKNLIRLKRNYTILDVDEITSLVLKEYGDYLVGRVNSFLEGL